MLAKTYYKATRPDGGAFADPSVVYRVGKVVKPRQRVNAANRVLCRPGLLHAADVPTETLVGGVWPCRLFEVTGRPVRLHADHPHKAGFVRLRVVRELPAWQALGPLGREVVAIIQRVARLTTDDATRLKENAGRYAARDAAGYAAENAARHAARQAAGYAAQQAAENAAEYAAENAAEYAAEYATRDAARHAALDAARAFVVRDKLPREHFDTLAGPWLSVMGEPAVSDIE